VIGASPGRQIMSIFFVLFVFGNSQENSPVRLSTGFSDQ